MASIVIGRLAPASKRKRRLSFAKCGGAESVLVSNATYGLSAELSIRLVQSDAGLGADGLARANSTITIATKG